MKGTKISKGVKNSYEIWTKLLIDWDNKVTQKFQFPTEGKNIELLLSPRYLSIETNFIILLIIYIYTIDIIKSIYAHWVAPSDLVSIGTGENS